MNLDPDSQPPAPQPLPGLPAEVLVFGGGGHGKAVIDLLRALPAYHLAGVVDDRLAPGDAVMGAPVLPGDLKSLYRAGIRLAANAVGGIGDISVRVRVFDRLVEAGFGFPTLVHPTAFVEPGAHLAPGAQLFPHAYAGSDATIGFGVILNYGVGVGHDCVVGDYTNISPGAMLAGAVDVGARVLIGMNATINIGVRVGEGARIGNGATVKKDVPPGGIVRAGAIWPE